MGVPYVPVRGLAGTDILARRTDMLIAHNPFNAEEKDVVAMAINPDVAICHALKADKFGNAIFRRGGDELLVAQASDRVIVTAEEIVDQVTAADPDGQFISSLNVTAVVHAPHGAHPFGVESQEIRAAKLHGPGGRAIELHDGATSSCFATTAFSHQPKRLTFVYVEGDAIHSLNVCDMARDDAL